MPQCRICGYVAKTPEIMIIHGQSAAYAHKVITMMRKLNALKRKRGVPERKLTRQITIGGKVYAI